MDVDASELLLKTLTENVNRLLDHGFGVNHAEATLFQIVEHLDRNQNLKSIFICMVNDTLLLDEPAALTDKSMAPVELIELVAHELKWKEIREKANDRIKFKFDSDRSQAVGDASQKILNAFESTWENRQFFSRYQ